MCCAEFLAKYLLFIVNLVFALGGLTLLGIGAAIQWQVSAVLDIFQADLDFAPILSMVTGGLVFLIAFFGCCGAVRRSSCMLTTYSLFLFILMILQATLSIIIFVQLDSLLDAIPGWLSDVFNQNGVQLFHDLETAFSCCGTTGAASYGGAALPASCCAEAACSLATAYPGCNVVVVDFFRTFGQLIAIMSLAVLGVELIAVIFAMFLARDTRRKANA